MEQNQNSIEKSQEILGKNVVSTDVLDVTVFRGQS